MHPINKLLSRFGLQLSRVERASNEFLANYYTYLARIKKASVGFDVSTELYFDDGTHPSNCSDYECAFAAYHIMRLNPKSILDIGTYRQFILGMLAHFQVTTIDIRDRTAVLNNEVVITCDAKALNLPSNEFDVVTSLCSLEHFGLGRYGDEFDIDADKKAFEEMIRVLKPNGHLIFTTTITRAHPTIVFNAHRIYSYDMLRAMCRNLICEEEKFYSQRTHNFCTLEDVSTEPNVWDVYCGCWKKPPHA